MSKNTAQILYNIKKDDFEYYDELRKSLPYLKGTASVEVNPLHGEQDSSYTGRNLHKVKLENDSEILLCHIPVMLRYSNHGEVLAGAEAYAGSVGAMLAIHHFNTGDGSVVKELHKINETCNLRLTTEIIDTKSSPFDSLKSLNEMLARDPLDASNAQPCALMGSQLSPVTGKLASITGIYDLLQVSSAAMSSSLDNIIEYPTLARTHTDVGGFGEMSTSYLLNHLGISNFGLLFPNDSYGLSFQKSILESAASKSMIIVSSPYLPPNSENSKEELMNELRRSISVLKETGFHYFVGAFYADTYALVMELAYDQGIAGPGFFWLTSGTAATAPFLMSGNFIVEKGSNLARAISGNGIIFCKGGLPGIDGSYDSFSTEWANIGENSNALHYMNSKQPKMSSLNSVFYPAEFFQNLPHHIVTFSYDAIVGIGLSACKAKESIAKGSIFSGKEHYRAFVNNSFRGASGDVVFRETFPTRTASSSYFVMANLALTPINDTHSSFKKSPIPYYFNTKDLIWESYGSHQFIYSDDTIYPPIERTVTKNITISIAMPIIIVLLSSIVGLLFVKKRKQIDSTWVVKPSELIFEDPPVILGRGTFGLVLLAEYRGTQVAVKRVLPPKEKVKSSNSTTLPCSSLSISFFEKEDGTVPMNRLKRSLSFRNKAIPTISCPANLVQVTAGDNEDLQQRKLSDILDTFSFKDEDPTDEEIHNFLEVGMSAFVRNREGMDVSAWSTKSRSESKLFNSKFTSKSLSDRKFSNVKEEFIKEMRLLSKLRHPCITTIMGAVVAKEKEPLLIMEYMDYGSLHDLLHNETMAIHGDFVLHVLRDIGQGLQFLHAADPKIIHGDLKSANILVDVKFRAKVADFGFSHKKQVRTGTPFWMAPELLQGSSRNTTASDVYSFGMILYEVYSRRDPYEGESDLKKIIAEICDPYINKRPARPENMPPTMSSLMTKCLYRDPESRPNFQEIVKELKILNENSLAPLKSSSQLKKENERKDKLLYDMLPKHIADSLREGRKIEPECHECVTIFFSDIVGFTTISSLMTPLKVSNMLDRLYQKMDALADKHGIFKVETIGDAWMGVTNVVHKQPNDHALRIAKFALDAVEAARETHIDEENLSKGFVQIRVGLHSGPVVTNVIGSRNPRFSLFGDTVNTASRMESNSEPGCIQCSDVSADLLKPFGSHISVLLRGEIPIKGKGTMTTYWIQKNVL